MAQAIPLLLQDPIRQLCYELVLERLIPAPAKILDVGCRDSGFPAWLTKIGYDVTACDMDIRFLQHQNDWKCRLGVEFSMFGMDVRNMNTACFDASTSIFALQHSLADDECFAHLARITHRQLFTSFEFHPTTPGLIYGRDDGPVLRIYTPRDIAERIVAPIQKIWGTAIKPSIEYLNFDHPSQRIHHVSPWRAMEANMAFLHMSRRVSPGV